MVPRISDMLFQHHRAELSRRTGTGGGAAEQLKEELREKVMGGRLLWAISASAPPSAATTAFVEDCLHARLLDGYGSTEGGIVALDGRVLRLPVTDHKPADVPELGHFGTDSPHPRGELPIKSDRLVPGYFRRPDATTGVFDEDGFYRTGDIMTRFGPDELRYVDRRNNVLKLSQGEFVTVSRLEALFNGSPDVRQIFLYGNSARAHLLAVVVPTEDARDRAAGDVGRLTFGLLTTGIAPGSFYARGTGDGRAHYDALAVDFTVRAVASLGDDAREGHRTYDVVNPHEDGISLDTFVDWPTAAGHPLTRVHDRCVRRGSRARPCRPVRTSLRILVVGS
ncbi:hypothetical protein ACIODX_19265 [Streptomyces sp. NPDC088190]|uniref:hypothetical protein n=1 Tax=unclassified Streptomyces TaxID=2593676 RepID=UPI00381AD092